MFFDELPKMSEKAGHGDATPSVINVRLGLGADAHVTIDQGLAG